MKLEESKMNICTQIHNLAMKYGIGTIHTVPVGPNGEQVRVKVGPGGVFTPA